MFGNWCDLAPALEKISVLVLTLDSLPEYGYAVLSFPIWRQYMYFSSFRSCGNTSRHLWSASGYPFIISAHVGRSPFLYVIMSSNHVSEIPLNQPAEVSFFFHWFCLSDIFRSCFLSFCLFCPWLPYICPYAFLLSPDYLPPYILSYVYKPHIYLRPI